LIFTQKVNVAVAPGAIEAMLTEIAAGGPAPSAGADTTPSVEAAAPHPVSYAVFAGIASVITTVVIGPDAVLVATMR
jgi:hypothetical protein